MRIIQIIPSLQVVGGAERFVVDLSIAQKNLGHDVLIISLYEKGKCFFEQEIIENNLNVIFLNKRKGLDWANARLLRKVILNFNPDVINTHISSHLSMELSGLWKRKSSIGFYHTIHNVPEIEARKPISYIIMKSKYKKGIVHPICISNSLADNTQNYYNLTKKPQAIYNGIFINKYKNEMSIRERTNNFISVASFAVKKNQIMIAKAAIALKKKGYEISLVFVGGGSQLENVKNYVTENQAEEHIKFLGQINNVNEVLAESKCFLLPSFYEGNPISILEAMAAGLAVIATQEGGPKDVIDDNINGYLVDPSSLDDLIEKMKKILNEPEQLEKFSKNNIEKVQQYDMISVAQKYVDYYKKFIIKSL